MSTSGFSDWFMGRTPAQRERQRRAAAHPLRTAILCGVSFAIWMVVYFSVLGNLAWAWSLILGIGAGLFFGSTMAFMVRRQVRRFS